jgi:hypothetical protein
MGGGTTPKDGDLVSNFGPLASIIHPSLQRSLTKSGVNSARIRIEAATDPPVRNGTNEIIPSWDLVGGLTGVPGRIEVGGKADQRTDTRMLTFEVDADQWVITLAGYFPEITVHMQAVDLEDGTAYDIVSVAWDNEHSQTVLLAELVTT